MVKKLALVILILTLISGFTVPAAEAGSKSLLKALALGGLFAAFPPPPVFVSPMPRSYYPAPRSEYVPGHWETNREWVPDAWERIWIPAHRDRWGNWVAGHYESRQTPGHYVEGRIWVDGYYR